MSIPGYVDLQVNGHLGVDFSSPSLTEQGFLRAAESLFADGTVIFLPTLITLPLEIYYRNISIIRSVTDKYGLEGHIPGVHLEGPFLSPAPGAVGCHNPKYIQPPAPELLEQINRETGCFIRLLTVAADQSGVEELIRYACDKNITVSLGHHFADSLQLSRAADAGARVLTHLGNALPNQIDRHHNPIWAGLAEDRLKAMLICDGHHLPPELIKSIIRVKGIDNIIAVSDASPVTGMPPGEYNSLGNRAYLESNGKFHNPEKGCLVGSAATQKQCITYLRSLELLKEEELAKIAYFNPLKLIDITV